MSYQAKIKKSQILFKKAEGYRQQNDYENAIKYYEDSINVMGTQPSAYVGIAMCQLQSNEINKARKNFNLAFQFSKYTQRTPDTKYNYGIFLRETGRINESKTYFRDITETSKPFNILGFYELVMIDAYNKISDKVMRRMKALLNSKNTNRILKTYLYFAFGKIYRNEGNYKLSWLNYYRGNSLSYNKQIRDSRIDSLLKIKKNIIDFFNINRFNPTNIKLLNSKYNKNILKGRKLILITGMPRSGTTLVENILSTNKNVFGMGETETIAELLTQQCEEHKKNEEDSMTLVYEQIQKDPTLLFTNAEKYFDYITKLATTSDYIDEDTIKIYLDKSTSNIVFLGFILLMFPETKIINCERNFLDNALSLYFNKFEEISHCWTTNLTDIIRYYKINEELTRHWKQIFPENFYNLKYETLVNNTETTIKSLLNFCNLEWSENYLNFHKNKRTFFSKNSFKVRQPIYNTSINNWNEYETYIGELISYANHINLNNIN